MNIADRLRDVATEDLAEEIARRLRGGAVPSSGFPAESAAAPAASRPMKKRSVWAREKAAGLKKQLEDIQSKQVIGEKELQRKLQAVSANQAQIDKFESIARAAERKGN